MTQKCDFCQSRKTYHKQSIVFEQVLDIFVCVDHMDHILSKDQKTIKEIAIGEFDDDYKMILIHDLPMAYSELAVWTQTAGKHALLAVVSNKSNYGYIFFNDGSWTHGIFRLGEKWVCAS